MHASNPTHWRSRLLLATLCTLSLGACGLVGGHGSLATGNHYQAEGKYRAAFIEAKKVLQHNAKDGNAWLLLGRASLELGNPKDALSELEHAKANGAPDAQWVVPMGQALLISQQFDKLLDSLPAKPAFDAATNARVAVLRGEAYRGLKHGNQAHTAYAAALALQPNDPRALVGLARLAAADGDAASANKYVQQALAAAPESPQAWIAKGDLAASSNDVTGAEAAYQKVLGFKHADWLPQERFYALSQLARIQVQAGQLDKALTSIGTLEKMAPQQPFPHYLHALVLYRQKHFDEAVAQLQQVQHDAPHNAQANLLMGAVNYAQGNYSQAQMHLSNALGNNPNDTNARKLLALSLYRAGHQQQALATLRPVVPGQPSDKELLAQLQQATTAGATLPGLAAPAASTGKTPPGPLARANQALSTGNTAEAIHLLETMPAGDASLEAQRNIMLVVTYEHEKRADEAMKTAAAYVAKHPKESGAHLLYGTTLITAGKRDQARAEYTKALKLNPKNLAALLSLGSLDALEGHYANANNRYQAALKLDPASAAAMVELGQLAIRQNDSAGATQWFKRAIHAAPKTIAAYAGLIAIDTRAGRFAEAADTAKQLVAIDPHNAAALNALGAAELNARDVDAALPPLQQAVNLDPKVALYRLNLARAQILGKHTDDATRNLKEAIQGNPSDVAAVTLLAQLKLQQHDLPGALALAQALQKQPTVATRAAGYGLQGDLYAAGKSWDTAVQAYQQGLKLEDAPLFVAKIFQARAAAGVKQPETILTGWLAKHPNDVTIRLLLGQYYLGQSRNQLAAAAYERVLKAQPANIGALNNLAWIYTGQHNPKALALAERAHKLAPNAPGITDTYAWALLAANQPKAALPLLQQAAKAAPKAADIQYHLAVAQARTGNKTGARATLEALQKSGAKFADSAAADKLYAQLGGGAK